MRASILVKTFTPKPTRWGQCPVFATKASLTRRRDQCAVRSCRGVPVNFYLVDRKVRIIICGWKEASSYLVLEEARDRVPPWYREGTSNCDGFRDSTGAWLLPEVWFREPSLDSAWLACPGGACEPARDVPWPVAEGAREPARGVRVASEGGRKPPDCDGARLPPDWLPLVKLLPLSEGAAYLEAKISVSITLISFSSFSQDRYQRPNEVKIINELLMMPDYSTWTTDHGASRRARWWRWGGDEGEKGLELTLLDCSFSCCRTPLEVVHGFVLAGGERSDLRQYALMSALMSVVGNHHYLPSRTHIRKDDANEMSRSWFFWRLFASRNCVKGPRWTMLSSKVKKRARTCLPTE